MKTRVLFWTISFLLLIIIMNACEHHPKELIPPVKGEDTTIITPNPDSNCNPDTVYFQNTIMKIINTACNGSGCHNATDLANNVNLSDYSHIKKYVQNGDLMDKITDRNPNDRMPPPPAPALDATTINLIKKWIAQGYKNNACNEGCDSTQYSYTYLAPIVGKNCGGGTNSCHFSGSAATKIGTYADLKAVGINQKLMGALNHLTGYQPMPSPSLKLSACDVKKFQKWIDSGYPQ